MSFHEQIKLNHFSCGFMVRMEGEGNSGEITFLHFAVACEFHPAHQMKTKC